MLTCGDGPVGGAVLPAGPTGAGGGGGRGRRATGQGHSTNTTLQTMKI